MQQGTWVWWALQQPGPTWLHWGGACHVGGDSGLAEHRFALAIGLKLARLAGWLDSNHPSCGRRGMAQAACDRPAAARLYLERVYCRDWLAGALLFIIRFYCSEWHWLSMV